MQLFLRFRANHVYTRPVFYKPLRLSVKRLSGTHCSWIRHTAELLWHYHLIWKWSVFVGYMKCSLGNQNSVTMTLLLICATKRLEKETQLTDSGPWLTIRPLKQDIVPLVIKRFHPRFHWGQLTLEGMGVNVWIRSHIAQYPIIRVAQSALYFQYSLTDLFNRTPSQLLRETKATVQLMREDYSYTNSHHCL